ncbi:hypothetical protein Pfo_027998 [Paulownia fortunei]|nr:hypothetical protein Pfo_027998 [Paulownia fortunei]
MGREKLLCIEPQELTFLELGKQASCTIRLSNNSREHVAFKVMTTNPEKYFVRPNIGVLLPRSSCDVKVTMLGPKEAPSNMHCKDKFLIKSLVASPGDTAESSRKLFNEKGRVAESCKLRVVYVFQSHQQSSNFERSGAGSSLNASTVQERNLNDTEQDRNGRHVGDLFMKGIYCLAVFDLLVPHHEDAATHMEFDLYDYDVGNKDDEEAGFRFC